jgi:hypothetical protein
MNKQQAGNIKQKAVFVFIVIMQRNGSSVHYLTANPVI